MAVKVVSSPLAAPLLARRGPPATRGNIRARRLRQRATVGAPTVPRARTVQFTTPVDARPGASVTPVTTLRVLPPRHLTASAGWCIRQQSGNSRAPEVVTATASTGHETGVVMQSSSRWFYS